MKALILAAGYATRLFPLTQDRPKALLEVRGKAILDYIAAEIATIAEIDEIIVISNAKFYSHFLEWAGRAGISYGKKITVLNDHTTDESNKLGAIRDMQYAIDTYGIDEDVVVIAGDNLFTYKLKDSYDLFIRSGRDLVLAKTMPLLSDLQRMAVGLLDENGIIIDMEEKPRNPKSDIAFFATYFYRRDTLPLIREYLDQGNPPDAPGYFPSWLYMRKPVMAHLFQGECYDIGTVETYYEVQKNFEPG